jgi:hypothetical protein
MSTENESRQEGAANEENQNVSRDGGFLFGIHWGWGLVGMWCAFVLDENLRGIIFVQRWNSLKWTKKGFVK